MTTVAYEYIITKLCQSISNKNRLARIVLSVAGQLLGQRIGRSRQASKKLLTLKGLQPSLLLPAHWVQHVVPVTLLSRELALRLGPSGGRLAGLD